MCRICDIKIKWGFYLFFKLFLERKEGREEGREGNINERKKH